MIKFMQKYTFNTETLVYEEINRSVKQNLFRITPYFLFLILGGLSFYLYYTNFSEGSNMKIKENYSKLLSDLSKMNKDIKIIQKRDNSVYRALLDIDPIPVSGQNASFGGTDRYKNLEGYSNSSIVIETSKQIDILKKKLEMQEYSLNEIETLTKTKETRLSCIPGIQPIHMNDLTRIASYYGYRTDPIYKVRTMHHGIDFSAHTGTPIYATGNAVVANVKKSLSKRGYGYQILLDHDFNYTTLYAHLSKILVKKGQIVKRGEIIGLVGNTGKSVGPHLHYEVRYKAKSVNPIDYYYLDINASEYDEMLKLASIKGGNSLD